MENTPDKKMEARSFDRRKEEVEARLMKMKECEKKGVQIVERLLQPSVTEDFLTDIVKFINPEYYQDAVVERAIVKLCGYPLCDKLLGNIPKQKYHISMKSNRVYDLSDRKNFCSNWCFKASEAFKKQLLTTPLLMRETEEIPRVKLLSEQKKQVKYDDSSVVLGSLEVISKQEIELIERKADNRPNTSKVHSDKCNDEISDEFSKKLNLKEMEQAVEVTEEEGNKTQSCTPATGIDVSSKLSCLDRLLDRREKLQSELESQYVYTEEQKGCVNQDISRCNSTKSSDNKEDTVINLKKDIDSSPSKATIVHKEQNSKLSAKKVKMSPFDFIFMRIQEWLTAETIDFIKGTKHQVLAAQEQRNENIEQIIFKHENEFAATLDSDDRVDKESKGTEKLPDFEQLKKDAQLQELKVKEFYGASFKYPTELENSKKQICSESDDAQPQCVLPLVDSKSQMAIRRKIVLERLDRVLPDILRPLHLTTSDIGSDVRQLVGTFKLTCENIVFKPAEWTLIALALIYVLSEKVSTLKDSLNAPHAKTFMSSVFRKLGITFEELDTKVSKMLKESYDIENEALNKI